MFSPFEERLMTQLLALAQEQEGKTGLNPMVAAAVYQGETVVSMGAHRCYGGDHAEVEALKLAGEKAKGASMMVTLEPCTHVGQTPPCVDAIISNGISSVVFAMKDPNPKVEDAVQLLEEAGVQVRFGLLNEDAEWLNRRFIKNVTQQLPYVTLKIAQSQDGKIAEKKGAPTMITSKASRQDVHRLRRRVDAVVTGIGTVNADDPQMTVRYSLLEDGFSNPKIVVFDSELKISPTAKLFENRPKEEVFLFCQDQALNFDSYDSLSRQAIIKTCDMGELGLDWMLVLKTLYDLRVGSIMIEAGCQLNSSAVLADIVDECVIYTSPMVLGEDAYTAFEEDALKNFETRFTIHQSRKVGDDVCDIFIKRREPC